MVHRAGLEPASTSLPVKLNDLEDFILFAEAKLKLTKLTALQYSNETLHSSGVYNVEANSMKKQTCLNVL